MESRSAQSFILTNESEYMACGIMSGITGNRAHGIIIDDPVKGREQADSKTIQEKTWDAYQDDLLTRLTPGGWIILIQTRWSISDLAGRILPSEWNGESGNIFCNDGHEWNILSIPAQCESVNDPLNREIGDYIWPEWFDKKHWDQFKTNARTWAALYQQRPTIAEGNFFKPDFIQTVDALPAGLDYVRAWDLAATANGGDYTTGVKLAYDKQNRVAYISDVIRGQYGPEDVERILLNTAKADGLRCKILIPQDPGQAGKAQVRNLVKLLSGFSIIAETVSGDKETRASPVAAQVNIGNVFMLRSSWNRAFIEELRLFPNGINDDQCDALSDSYNHFTIPKIGSF